MRRSPASNTPTAGSSTPPSTSNLSTTPPALLTSAAYDMAPESNDADDYILGSPLKRQRASLPGLDDDGLRKRFGLGIAGGPGEAMGLVRERERGPGGEVKGEEGDEEL